MIKNYFKTAFRSLWRNKIFSIIKVLGLSLGLTVCMLIFLYTKDEVSYDRFHKNHAQLYRVIQSQQVGENQPQTMGITNGIVGETFAKEIPEVQQCVRVNGEFVTVKRKDNDVQTEKVMFVDDNFFNVFTFEIIQGDKRTALKDYRSIVLSRDMAKKYFGTEDVVGENLQVKLNDEFENYAVTAVTENPPQNSTINGDMYIRIQVQHRGNEWLGGTLNTFLLLSPNADVAAVEAKMKVIFDRNTKDFTAKAEKEMGVKLSGKLLLQRLTDIHLSKTAGPVNGMAQGSKSEYSYTLTCIAIFILIMACINFINLAVAQSLKRSKEIGVRKVIGGTRSQLIKQFLTESFAVSLVLSAFQPVKVLYNRQKLMGKNILTKGLIVLQFSLAVFLVIAMIVVNRQVKYLLHKDLGYDSRNVVNLSLPYSAGSDKLPALFKNELDGQKDILSVVAQAGGRSISGVKANGKNITIEYTKIDDSFFSTFKIPILAGRDFSSAYPSDSNHSVIVNESLVKETGWKIDEAIGKKISFMDDKQRSVTIVGVIRDYHFTSLKEKITPALFSMDNHLWYGQLWVKISPENAPQTLAVLESTFKKLVPFYPYSYDFLDDLNKRNYDAEEKWKQIISIASALFVFISCIGLFGLVMIAIEQRTKEIGIRKVLGAEVSGLVMLISGEFVALISIAFLIAIPVAYYFINNWLQDFPYRVGISWWMFALGGAIIMLVALATMSVKAIRAAISNPIKSLRTE